MASVSPRSTLPTGRQLELARGPVRAVVTEVGAGLRCLELDGRPLVWSFPEDEMPSGGQGQLLVPWPNRLAGGRWSWAGRDLRLPLDEPEHANAIHGLVRWSRFDVVAHDGDHLALSLMLPARPGWPFVMEVGADYRLTGSGCTVTITGRNHGRETIPFGAGCHPYLLAGEGPVDLWRVDIPATRALRTDERGIPTGTFSLDGDPLDARGGMRVGSRALDTAYGHLLRSEDGRARAVVSGDGCATELWVDGGCRWIMAYTGDTLADPRDRRRALALEPMTCPPNALATGEDLVLLEPGESASVSFGIEGAEG